MKIDDQVQNNVPGMLSTECDPREFVTNLWMQLSQHSRNPEARSFMRDEGCDPNFRWHYPDDKIVELEKALMT